MAKKTAARTKTKTSASARKPAGAKGGKGTRVRWFDDKSGAPLIERYARQLNSFMEALRDGRVEDDEVKKQERRLVSLMREVEPLLDGPVHGKVTELLCELTAYDLMQVLNAMDKARHRQSAFRG